MLCLCCMFCRFCVFFIKNLDAWQAASLWYKVMMSNYSLGRLGRLILHIYVVSNTVYYSSLLFTAAISFKTDLSLFLSFISSPSFILCHPSAAISPHTMGFVMWIASPLPHSISLFLSSLFAQWEGSRGTGVESSVFVCMCMCT